MVSNDQPTVYIVATAAETDYGCADIAGSLHTEDGKALWGHVSSSPGWLRRDLTAPGERMQTLVSLFPQGFKVRWLGPGDVRPWEAPESTHADAHDLTERAAHLARLGWAVEKHAARGEVEVRIADLRDTAKELEEPCTTKREAKP